jgi:hypothetical protein
MMFAGAGDRLSQYLGLKWVTWLTVQSGSADVAITLTYSNPSVTTLEVLSAEGTD